MDVPHADQQTAVDTTKLQTKRQPWISVWPAPREPQSQANMFGFKKGELMVFDGNAGNFFAKRQWEVEQESPRQN